MKRKILLTVGAALLLAALMLLASCQDYPYDELAEDGYNICVKFDANGGDFANNGKYMTIVDVYASGNDTITLYAPNAAIRGPEFENYDAEKTMPKYQLEGWYIVPTNDKGEILDEDGNPCGESGKEPAYGQKLDFALTDDNGDYIYEDEKLILNNGVKYTLDNTRSYTRENPLTICAKWVPHCKFEFHAQYGEDDWVQFTDNGKPVIAEKQLELPSLNISRSENCNGGYGNWDFYKFNPTMYDQYKEGYTLVGIYLDPECTIEIPLTEFDTKNVYSGTQYFEAYPEFNSEENIKIYTKWEEGNWFSIYTADQFSSVLNSIVNTTLSQRLVDVKIRIMADLDFGSASEYGWLFADTKASINMSIDEESFAGFDIYIDGCGHSFKNINAIAAKDSKYGGIFKKLADGAVIKNLTFENSSFTVPSYTKKTPAAFGFLTGDATGVVLENIVLRDCSLIVSSSVIGKILDQTVEIYAGTPDEAAGIDYSALAVTVPEGYEAAILSGGYVKIEKITV